VPLSFVRPSDAEATVYCAPSSVGVLCWNTRAAEGSIALRVRFAGANRSAWLPYVKWSPRGRESLYPRDEEVTIETDVIRAIKPFDAIDVRASERLDAIALATPPVLPARPPEAAPPFELAVPECSQYVESEERGWCSAASLTMLLRYHAQAVDVASVAAAVYDDAYRGTGNWAFNMAYASSFGLRAFVAYLRDLDHARSIVERGLPLALSYAWKAGELDGAPLAHSAGHLAVLRGFDAAGDPIVNDPAQPAIRTAYRRAQLECAWLAHGGVSYMVAPTSGPDPAALVNETA
jgi:hypothetical protein